MAVFHESETAATVGGKKISPIIIAVIVVAVLLCCCCVAAVAVYLLRHQLGLVKKETFLPLYLTLRTFL